jgi:hypothetical protein
MSFKPRDMVKNPRVGDCWLENNQPRWIGPFTARIPAAIQSMLNRGSQPACVIPFDLALSLHAALTNFTEIKEIVRLIKELEEYLPKE